MPLTPPPKSIWDRPSLALLISMIALVLLLAYFFIYGLIHRSGDHRLLGLTGGGALMFTVMALGFYAQRRRVERDP